MSDSLLLAVVLLLVLREWQHAGNVRQLLATIERLTGKNGQGQALTPSARANGSRSWNDESEAALENQKRKESRPS